MKKFYALIILIISSLFALCGCATISDKDVQKFNYKAQQTYDEIVLNFTTEYADGAELTDTFTVDFSEERTKVSYSIRRFTEITADSASQDFITTTSGVVYLNADGTEEVFGEEEDLPLDRLTKIPFTFLKDYFSDIRLSSSTFSANVTNTAAFWGVNDFDGTNTKVEVLFEGDYLQVVTMTYTAANGTYVTAKYEFFRL